MKKNIIILLTVFSISCFGMELSSDVQITTSDNQCLGMQRWQVRESNSLYALFLEQLKKFPDKKPIEIIIPTVSYDELCAYSNAQKKQEDFERYYNETLTPMQRRMLTIAVGEHARNDTDNLIPKLYDVAMSMKILSLTCDQSMLTNAITLFFSPKYDYDSPILCMMNHFKRLTVMTNACNAVYNLITEGYFNNGNATMIQKSSGDGYNAIPNDLVYRRPYMRGASMLGVNFNGYAYPVTVDLSDGNEWKIDQCCTIVFACMTKASESNDHIQKCNEIKKALLESEVATKDLATIKTFIETKRAKFEEYEHIRMSDQYYYPIEFTVPIKRTFSENSPEPLAQLVIAAVKEREQNLKWGWELSWELSYGWKINNDNSRSLWCVVNVQPKELLSAYTDDV